MASRPSFPKSGSEGSGTAKTVVDKPVSGKPAAGRAGSKPDKASASRVRDEKMSALGTKPARSESGGSRDPVASGQGVHDENDAALPRARGVAKKPASKRAAGKTAPSRGTTRRGVAGKGSTKVAGVRGRPAVFTRDDILAAAKLAFSKAGYANVTLDDLAALLNTGKGTLYYHSNKKVDLLIAISNKTVEDNTYELRKIASVNASPEARFILAMRALMQGVLGDQPASKVYFENEADLPPKFRANLRRLLREIQQVFEDIIAEGVAQGVFQGEPRILAKHVLSVCAWPYRWFSPEGELSLDEFITTAVNFALAGIRAPQMVMHERLAARPGRTAPDV